MTWIFCSGMMRSGSTVQFQLTSSIVETAGVGCRHPYIPATEFSKIQSDGRKRDFAVFKSHLCLPDFKWECLNEGAMVVYCYRDIRDVAVSAMRKFDMSFDALVDAGWLDQALTDYYAWTNMPNVLVSRYEEMISNLSKEASRIVDFLGLNVDYEALSILAEQYELPAQQQRIDVLKQRYGQSINASNVVFDEVELLHHNHIHKGEVDGWRDQLSPLQQRFLTERYRQWLLSLGYDLEQ